MKKIFFIICILLIVSCNKDKFQERRQKIPPLITAFSFKDTNGVDLLNQQNPNAFNFYAFRLYYITNGIKEEVYNNLLDYPRNMILSCSNELPVCVMSILLSDTNILEILGTNISDTICLENNGHIIRYNGKVVWDAAVDSWRIPIATIIK